MSLKEPLHRFSEEIDMFGFDSEQYYFTVDIRFEHLPRTKLNLLKEFFKDMGWIEPDPFEPTTFEVL